MNVFPNKDQGFRFKTVGAVRAHLCRTYYKRHFLRLDYGDGCFEWFEFDTMALIAIKNNDFEVAFQKYRQEKRRASQKRKGKTNAKKSKRGICRN